MATKTRVGTLVTPPELKRTLIVVAASERASGRSRIIVEVDVDPAVLRGSLTLPDQSVHAFTGWLELANAVETVHRDLAQSIQPPGADVPFGVADSSIATLELPTRPAGSPPGDLPEGW